jgi:hypothetical protein
MTTETNLELRLGDDWAIPFAPPPAGGVLAFELALGDVLLLRLDTDDNAGAFDLAAGSVTVAADLQAGLAPETYLYELRATAADDTITCVQIGRIMAGASLFRLPTPEQQEGIS